MIKILLTTDPATGRALYDDEAQVLGQFSCLLEAENKLGDLLRFCTISFESHPAVI